MASEKRKWGDRKDGTWIREADSMHLFMPYLYRKRTGAEAVIQDKVPVDALLAYIDKKNGGLTEDKYTVFHAFLAAINKTITLRPAMNRFYKGGRYYQRDKVSLAFVARKKFVEKSEESLLYFKCNRGDTITELHDRIYEKLNRIRKKDENDKTTDIIGVLCRFPRPIVSFIMTVFRTLDYFGKMPYALISDDPHYATVWITNLGSIKLNANYHHLNDWGTNSVFAVVGEMHDETYVDSEGKAVVGRVLPFSITVDERIADGYYYAKTIKLLKYLLTHPEELDKPAEENVDYE